MMFKLYQESAFSDAAVKQHLYSEIFDTEFNLGFHLPSKDLCDVCDHYRKAKDAGVLTADLTEQKLDCDQRKEKAREAKAANKLHSNTRVLTFNLQQVLACPKLQVGASYYRRKLNVYNLTF